MGETPPDHQWVVQPLLDVGLPPSAIESLLVRLAFEAVVDEGGQVLGRAWGPVDGWPPEVRAAWTGTLARMLSLEPPA